MEKWARSLSKTNALLFGIAALAIVFFIYRYGANQYTGLIPMLILCMIIGAGVGFATVMLFKGITGKTPQQKKEERKK